MPTSGNPSHRLVRSTKRRSDTRCNTVGLDERELERMLNEMDERGGDAVARREFVRWPFRCESITLRLLKNGAMLSELRVACRNLSSHGVGMLHSSFVHAGTRCVVIIPTPKGGDLQVEGQVVRCQHHSGMIHEIGVRFEEPINVREVLEPDPFSNFFSMENVDPSKLTGTIVHVGGSELDQKIVAHYLRGTQVRVRFAQGREEAMKLIGEGADMVILHHQPDDGTGLDVLRQMSDGGLDVPSILVTYDRGASVREAIAGANASAYLAKPLAQSLLLRAVAEFLVLGRDGVEAEGGAPDDPQAELVEGFIRELRMHAESLVGRINANDIAGCREICLQVMGTAPSLGFDLVAKVADRAVQKLDAAKAVTEAWAEICSLINVCENATRGGKR